MTTKNSTAAAQVRKRRGKTVTDAIHAGEYTTQPELPMVQRVAHLLDWAAQHYPKEYMPYNYGLKAVMGYRQLPRLGTEEVERFRGVVGRSRQVLQAKYARELDVQHGVGFRATTDSSDTLTVAFPKRMRRLDSAKEAVVRTASLIDVKQVPQTGELGRLRRWFEADARKVLDALKSATFTKGLLPPVTATDEEKE